MPSQKDIADTESNPTPNHHNTTLPRTTTLKRDFLTLTFTNHHLETSYATHRFQTSLKTIRTGGFCLLATVTTSTIQSAIFDNQTGGFDCWIGYRNIFINSLQWVTGLVIILLTIQKVRKIPMIAPVEQQLQLVLSCLVVFYNVALWPTLVMLEIAGVGNPSLTWGNYEGIYGASTAAIIQFGIIVLFPFPLNKILIPTASILVFLAISTIAILAKFPQNVRFLTVPLVETTQYFCCLLAAKALEEFDRIVFVETMLGHDHPSPLSSSNAVGHPLREDPKKSNTSLKSARTVDEHSLLRYQHFKVRFVGLIGRLGVFYAISTIGTLLLAHYSTTDSSRDTNTNLTAQLIIQVLPPLGLTTLCAILFHTLRNPHPHLLEFLATFTLILLLTLYSLILLFQDLTPAGQARYFVRASSVATTAAESCLLSRRSMGAVILATSAGLAGTYPIHRDAGLAAQGIAISVLCLVVVETQRKRWSRGYGLKQGGSVVLLQRSWPQRLVGKIRGFLRGEE